MGMDIRTFAVCETKDEKGYRAEAEKRRAIGFAIKPWTCISFLHIPSLIFLETDPLLIGPIGVFSKLAESPRAAILF